MEMFEEPPGPDNATLDALLEAELDAAGEMTTFAVALIHMQRGGWVHPTGQPHLVTRDLNQIRDWIDDDVPVQGHTPVRQ
jgi:hypothetical protein